MENKPEFPNGEWDKEVAVEVICRVKARPGPDHEEGYGRTPMDAARAAVFSGRYDLDKLDGYVDLEGYVDIIDVLPSWGD